MMNFAIQIKNGIQQVCLNLHQTQAKRRAMRVHLKDSRAVTTLFTLHFKILKVQSKKCGNCSRVFSRANKIDSTI